MLDPTGELVLIPWPLRVPAPPFLDAEIENVEHGEVEHLTATEAGYSDNEAPCNVLGRVFEAEAARRCHLVFLFKKLSIEEASVHAVTPTVQRGLDKYLKTAKDNATKIGKHVYPVLGSGSVDYWIGRLVIGTATMHDGEVALWNIQVMIIQHTISATDEHNNEALEELRQLRLASLRISFWQRQDQLVKLCDDT